MTDKEVIIKGSAAKGFREVEGFIAGQGGQEGGYGLYVKDNHLVMAVKQNGKVYTATSAETLPERFDFEGRLTANGNILVFVDGKQVGKGKAPSLFTKPLDGVVRVQRDFTDSNSIGAYTGAYTTAYDFIGNIQNATLEVRKSAADAPNPATRVATSDKATVLTIKVVEEQMKYDTKVITVKAGMPVVLTLENPDIMQHNLVICKPGSTEKVGKAADALARDPKGLEKNYVPQLPDVLAATKLVNPGESFTLEFTAPTKPGDYPFVCTFPGHWSIMQGIMRVEKTNVPTTSR